MSSPSQTAAPSSNFKSMLDTALAEYKKKTGNDLPSHWLADKLKTCESVDGVLNILRDQAKAFEQSGDQKLIKWIDPLVHVLYTFSGALGDGVSLAFPPAKVIFTGIGVLLAAAKDARASHAAIIDLFERIESFFKRLGVYTQTSLTTEMAEVLVKIVIELLSILSIATKEVKRRRAKIFARKLLGRTDIEDALKRLESLIQEEIHMVDAQILKIVTEAKDDADKANVVMQQNMEEVKRDLLEVKGEVVEVKCDVEEVKWTQIEQDIHKWLSPPDPSTNYNIACETHQEGTAAWFFRGKKFKDWTSIGSLLWIHGKPGSGKSILCSAIIKYVMSLRDAGQAALAFFYFDFRDKDKKQDFRNFITSLLVQLSAYSTLCCEIIFRIYSTHGKGTRQPSNGALMDCLREMLSLLLSLAAEQPIYIIVDALDECPNASGMPTPRKVVLDHLEGLVRLGLPNLHICITSRLEFDIKRVLGPLPHIAVSLHDEDGQKKDISDYVSDVVHADPNMRSWRDEDKTLVVNELSNRADGMFRWVFCQLEMLQHCFPANIRQTLRELPETLDETYARVLREINKTNQGHAHRMLQCLMVAVRPLRVEELAELLAFEFDTTQGGIPKYRATWRLGDQTQAVLSTCSSLITIVSDRRAGRQVVQFSHFSVKEFLMSDRLISPLGDFSRYHIRPGPAHIILTQACLGCLLHLHVDKENTKTFPLSDYAAQHWVEHARFEDVASHVKDGMETLFDSNKPHFAAWIGIHDIDTPEYYLWPSKDYSPRLVSHSPHPEDYSPHSEGYSPHPEDYSSQLESHSLHLEDYSPRSKDYSPHPEDYSSQLEFHSPQLESHSPQLGSHSPQLESHSLHLEDSLPHISDYSPCSTRLSYYRDSVTPPKPKPNPLYYSVLCGFYDLVKHLVTKYPQHVNAICGRYMFPLFAALGKDHVEVAELLLEHGANVDVWNPRGETPPYTVLTSLRCSLADKVRLLLKFKTSLHLVVYKGKLELAQILVEHGADVNFRDNNGRTPLDILLRQMYNGDGVPKPAPLLLEHGAEANRRNKYNETPLLPTRGDWFKFARILLEYGADASVKNNDGTPLHLLSRSRIHDGSDVLDFIRLLLEHGAAVNKRDKSNQTPLHLAMRRNSFKLARILLEHGADANRENNDGETPLHILIRRQNYEQSDVRDVPTGNHTRLWLEHGAEVNRRYKDNDDPLLLEIDTSMENKTGKTPVYQLSRRPHGFQERGVGVAQLLPERGVDVRDENHTIPSHLQSNFGPAQIAQVLLDHGANVNIGNDGGRTTLYQEIAGVHVVQNKIHLTLLHLASLYGRPDIARVLLDNGATIDSEDKFGRTPLHLVAEGKFSFEQDRIRLAQLLLERGTNVNARNEKNATPLHLASYDGRVAIARVLLDHGAAANSKDNKGRTPLHTVVEGRYLYSQDDGIRVAQLLLERGADANARDEDNRTPLHLASYNGRVEIARVLLDCGAITNPKDKQGRTPLHAVAEGGRDYDILARLLLERGADVNMLDNDNQPRYIKRYIRHLEG